MHLNRAVELTSDDRPVAPPSSSSQSVGPRFLRIWAGQTVSEIGSMLTGVAAAVFVFVETGNALWLGLLTAAASLPFLLVGLSASLIDRYPRRAVMIAADLIAAIGPVFALIMAAIGALSVGHLVVAGFIGGLGTAVQMAASQAAIPALVQPDAIDRANALQQIGPALGIVIGPMVATPVLVHAGIEAVLVVDLISFVIGVAAVVITPFVDAPVRAGPGDADPGGGVVEGADDGSWRYSVGWLWGEGRPLLVLMVMGSVINFTLAWYNLALLATATAVVGAARTGLVLGVGGLSMLVGSVVGVKQGLARDRIRILVVGLVGVATGGVLSGSRPHPVALCIGVVVALGLIPAVNAAGATLYNERTPPGMQGRVFAIRGAAGQALQPIGSLLAGAVIARIATPLMGPGGGLESSVGRLIGTGTDRGSALVLVVVGLVLAGMAVAVSRSRTLALLRLPVNPAMAYSAAEALARSERRHRPAGRSSDGGHMAIEGAGDTAAEELVRPRGGLSCTALGLHLHPDHDSLLGASGNRSVFLTADWLETWFSCFGSDHDVLNLAVNRRGELIGSAPLVVVPAKGSTDVRRLVVAGQQPTSGEHLDLVAERGSESTVAGAVAKVLTGALRRRWDVLTVQRILADSEVLGPFATALRAAGCRTSVAASGTSPYAVLPGSMDDFLAGKSKNFRSQLRQSRNRLARAGEVTICHLGRGLDLDGGLEEVFRLHRTRWGDTSSFDTDEKLAFHRRLGRRLAERDRLFLSLLSVDDTVVGARYDFVFDDRIWCIQGGWDPDRASSRPGMILTEDVLRWGIERGLSEYDFLGGPADYKKRWSTAERPLVTLVAANPWTIRGRLYGLRMAAQTVRDGL